jgi:response regulator RpfG family c-di-GMP phosphodiesterase
MSSRPKPRLRILLGSADAKTVRIFNEHVSTAGGDLMVGESSEAAARLARDERFDAVFVDAALPNLSRSGFARLVRKSKLNSRAPILMLAGLPAAASRSSADFRVMAKFAVPAELPPFLKAEAQKLASDRRKHRRLSFRSSVNCVEGIRRFRARSVNLGISGMLLETTFSIEAGTELQLYFYLAPGETALQTRARVVRLEAAHQMGVSFENMGNHERERLRQFLDLHLPAAR